MKISDRIKIASQLLFGGKKSSSVFSSWRSLDPRYFPSNYGNSVQYGFRKNELIYSCIMATVETASQVRMIVYDKKTGKHLPDHPLQLLIHNPNKNYEFTELLLWQSVIMFMKLAGVAYFELERSMAGRVVSMLPLRPDWVKYILKDNGGISHYEYHIPNKDVQIIEKDNVLVFRLVDPENYFTGYPPIKVAARVGDIDNSSTDFIKLWWENGGIPPGIITTTQKLSIEQIDEIREKWEMRYGGFDKWRSPAILDQDATYKKTGTSFSEMGFEVLDARNEARICMIMRVPPIIVHAQVGLERSTYSNYQEARVSWWEDTLIPFYQTLDEFVRMKLVPMFGGDIDIRWDFSKIPAMVDNENKKWENRLSALSGGAITVNEFRGMVGLPRLLGQDVIVRKLMDVVEPVVEEKELSKGVKSIIDPEETKKKKDEGEDPPDKNERDKIEKEINKEIGKALKAQKKRIIGEIKNEFGQK